MSLNLEALRRALIALTPVRPEPTPSGPLLVIAGSYAEFRAFCIDENLAPHRDAVFVDRPERLYGRRNFRWHIYGTGNRRTRELVHIAQSWPGNVYVNIPSRRDERERQWMDEGGVPSAIYRCAVRPEPEPDAELRYGPAPAAAWQVPALTPRTGLRIEPVYHSEGGVRWEWVCPVCRRRSAPWVDRPSVENARAEHDQFAGRSEPAPVREDVFL